MQTRKILWVLMFLVYYGNSQDIISNFKVSLKTSPSDIKDAFPIINDATGETALFLIDAKNVYGYKFNSDFIIIDSLISEEKRRTHKIIIGSNISKNGDHVVYLTNTIKSSLARVNFSFTEKKSNIKEFQFKENEKLIQSFTHNNKFYFLTNFNSDNLYINFFNDSDSLERKKIDLSKFKFANKNNDSVSFSSILDRTSDLIKIDFDIPHVLENTSENRKLYIIDNHLTFTFDANSNNTQLLKINLDSFNVEKVNFKKPLNYLPPSGKKSNSIINHDNIILIAANRDIFSMQIFNYKSGDFIKEFIFSKDENIAFANTPIIQENGVFDFGEREIDETKKFLRKITREDIGVSIYRQNDENIVTIGGCITRNAGGGGFGMMGGFGIPLAASGSVNIFFNPTAFAYSGTTITKSTHIKSRFDKNFNHIEGDIPKNVFDIIKNNDSTSTYTLGRTLFKYKDFFIKGYYNRDRKNYTLIKFKV